MDYICLITFLRVIMMMVMVMIKWQPWFRWHNTICSGRRKGKRLQSFYLILFFLFFFYCCSSTVVSIFTWPQSPIPPIPPSHPQTYPLWLCPYVLYTCFLMALPLFSPIIPLPSPLWLLPVWLYHLTVNACRPLASLFVKLNRVTSVLSFSKL